MSRTAKIISLLAALVVVGGLVTGIAFWTLNNDPSVQKPGLYVNNKRVNDPGVIVTVGGHEVDYDEYRYNYLYWKDMFEAYMGGGDANFWESDYDGSYAKMVKDQTEYLLKNTYGWLAIAEREGIALTDEEKADLAAEIDEEVLAQGSGLEGWLEQNYIPSEEFYRQVREDEALASKAMTTYRDNFFEAHKQELYPLAVAAKHILIQPDAEAEDTEAAGAAALEKAEEILRQIEESEDPAATFDELMAAESTDPGLAEYPNGYTFTDGVMVAEFYQGALALEVGEISGIIPTEHGYHILMRVPLDEEYIKNNYTNTSGMVPKIVEKWNEIYATPMEAEIEAVELVPGEYYDRIAIENVR